ncbi:MAG: YdeI/OmpD-associated family protein [Balneolaceae bacterium]|nr:YdeI/OmpD-associated family protein [Balneolaceae bacterium]
MPDHEQLFIESAEELRSWLEKNHPQKESVWLVRRKKAFTNSYLDYDSIVDELICYGWVDSLPRALDEKKTMLRISPRNPKSNWSGINKERVARLLEEGRMKKPGLDLVEIAKENGAWNFLDDVEQLIIPEDLQVALKTTSKASFYFNRFPDSSKRGILEWIKTAKQASTRQKRIEETAHKASQNIKANHPKGRDAGPKE